MASLESLRIAVLVAHPDDAEIWCGGTILKHASRGDEVRIYGFFRQEPGRVEYAVASGKVLGATYRSCRLDHTGMPDDETVVELAAFAPHLFLTHWQHDSHPDHVRTYQAAREAVIRLARASVYVRAMFSFTTYNNCGSDRVFRPEFYIDVGREWPAKVSAILVHADQDPERIVHDATPLFAAHGRVIGASFAEVFVEVPIFGRLLAHVRSPDHLG